MFPSHVILHAIVYCRMLYVDVVNRNTKKTRKKTFSNKIKNQKVREKKN